MRPVGGERAAAAGPGGSPSPAGHTAAASAPRATPADTVRAVGREAVASTVTDPSGGAGAAGLGAAPVAGAAAPRVAGGAVPPLAGAAASRATEGSPASGRAVPSAGAAGASPGSGAAASQAPATPAAPAAASDTVRPVGREAVASPVTDPSGGAGAAAPRVAGGSVTPLAGAASAPLAGTANAAPVNGAAAPHAAGASASAAPTLSPASAPDAPGTVRPATAGGAAGGGFRVAFGEKPDFRVITTARIGALAEPVAGVVRVVRRKNVIGTETTGSIPVHLLFRDEPHTAPKGDADDGGPDTVAMDAPGAKPRRTVIPSPGAVQAQGRKTARHAAAVSRPAPTADPDLVERPGRALPGWVGVVGGALAVAGSAAVVWWAGAVPAELARMLRLPVRPYHGIHLGQWALLALGVVATLFALGGLGRGRVGYAWVLTLFGDYRGTVRRTGLVWISPLLLRRRVDVRLRHWRSEPLPAVDAKGTALDVVVLVVWRVRDTVRAALGVDGHEDYLREQVEAAMARVLSQLPADAFHEDAPTLRDAEAVGEALTRMLSAECAPVGVDVFSAQPTRIEYAPAVAAAMQRRRIAAIDAKHRDSVLTSVVDAVDDVVHRLTSRGLVELDDYERKALVKDLTVAFYTGRTAPAEGA
ncbi:SPFH domain-containing protein [Streptomyces sp. NPDC003327]